ncbi:hypothetical protein [Streptomyces sp. AC627_RSS907]|uniref:hypothetical protein n=1 Tax=Streptomyces sp. AC627_RSS907 TaxID=2823684 RepID=UPI001C227685|nr:hypothetical protein [Streptomyces sp. AC627_RSS907]
MSKNSTSLIARAASTVAVLLVAGGASVVAVTNASAYTDSNKVHNCWGRYYNTDFDQMCGSGGAAATGNYRTTAPCDVEGDNSLTVYRNRGNSTTYDGPDCTFDVETGQTYYF